MSNTSSSETENLWNTIAQDWDKHVGVGGDKNRQINSDPVLRRFLGDVKGLKILDAGCGTGYLSLLLSEEGGEMTGVDFSEKMIEIANKAKKEKEEKKEEKKEEEKGEEKGEEKMGSVNFRVDSCVTLSTVEDESMDKLVSNYVLMDLEDLEGAISSFFRVLKHGGQAVVIFSHPCFPGSFKIDTPSSLPSSPSSSSPSFPLSSQTTYHWRHPYFVPQKNVDEPWGHFTENFIWYHRPLSHYWKAFTSIGFVVEGFEEPHLQPEQHHLVADELVRERALCRPYSVAFKLRKM